MIHRDGARRERRTAALPLTPQRDIDNIPRMSPQRNIALMGFMGTGKTRIGRELAARLGMRFIDMDDVIVEKEGKSIPAIFAEDGEPHFRNVERAVVGELACSPGLVIATGGGVVLNSDNLRDLAQTGLVICVSATPGEILKRVEHDTNRPLLAEGDKLDKIRSLLAARRDFYAAIPHQVDTNGKTPDEVVDEILSLYAG